MDPLTKDHTHLATIGTKIYPVPCIATSETSRPLFCWPVEQTFSKTGFEEMIDLPAGVYFPLLYSNVMSYYIILIYILSSSPPHTSIHYGRKSVDHLSIHANDKTSIIFLATEVYHK